MANIRSNECQRPSSPKSMAVASLSTFAENMPLFVPCGPTDMVTRYQGSIMRGHESLWFSPWKKKKGRTQAAAEQGICGAMALLSSAAAAAAVCAQVVPRPWRHGESCVGRVARGVKCRAQATEATSAQAEVTSAQAEATSERAAATETIRPLWLPGSTPPAYLDGTLAGDFGFDPLELGSDPNDLRWYVQAELVHARFAMAGVAGILFTDLLRASGRTDIPLWYEAGAYKFDFADTKTLFLVQLILMGFVETKRWMDFVKPGSQAAEDSFFGFEPAFGGLDNGYPGGPIFNPLGFAKDKNTAQPLRWKEIKNGRLAMVAMVGFIVQAYVTKTGPIENLMAHLSDPLHTTVIQRIANH